MRRRTRPAPRRQDRSAPTELSLRELEVLHLVAHGLSNRAIAARLVVAEGTVKNHVSSICRKLGVRGRSPAVIAARQAGLLLGQPPAPPHRSQMEIIP